MPEPFKSLAARSRGRADLVAPIRTYANAIIGFAEMLEDPELTLSDARRREYVEIVRLSGAALDKHIQDTLRDDEAAA